MMRKVSVDVFVANLENAKQAGPLTPAYPEASQKIGNAIDKALLAGTPGQQALDEAAKQVDRILGRAH